MRKTVRKGQQLPIGTKVRIVVNTNEFDIGTICTVIEHTGSAGGWCPNYLSGGHRDKFGPFHNNYEVYSSKIVIGGEIL